MVVFILLILLGVWCVIVLRAEHKHYMEHLDDFIAEDEPVKFSDTMKHYNGIKNINKQRNKQLKNG
jgi:transposase-like protein